MPLWSYFLFCALVYGAFQLIRGKVVEAVISGVAYAIAMTVILRVTRNRDRRAVGGRPISDVARLEQSLHKKGQLPSDFSDRVALQGLIARKRRQARFGAIFAPIVFGCMTVLGVVVGVTSGSWWFVPIFAAVTVLSLWAPVRARRRLDEKESRLNAALSGQPSSS
jgi:membrane protein implicated in regulation of membrane protease activity